MPVIKLFTNLRKLAGIKETQTNAINLRLALCDLVKQNPGLDGIILESGSVTTILAHIIITINGQLTSDLDTRLAPDDIIAIFPPIAGG